MGSVCKTKLLIFDFDGVIVESNGIKDKAFKSLFSDFPEHFDTMMRYHREHVSASRVKKFEYLLQITGKTADTVLMDGLMKKFSDYTLALMKDVSFVPGSVELLKSLKGVPMYLASVTPIEDLRIILDSLQLRSFFANVYGCPPWTKANAIRDILNHNAIAADEAILIGDSEGDMVCAKETGVRFIARNSGLPFSERPSLLFNDLNEVGTYLKKKVL